jgi:hypothetical protein
VIAFKRDYCCILHHDILTPYHPCITHTSLIS